MNHISTVVRQDDESPMVFSKSLRMLFSQLQLKSSVNIVTLPGKQTYRWMDSRSVGSSSLLV